MIQMFRGDTPLIRVSVVDQSGVIVDVSSSTSKLTLKSRVTDDAAAMQVVGSVLDGPGGVLGFQTQAAATALLSPGAYVYDVEVRIGSNVYTVVEDAFVVVPDVTT